MATQVTERYCSVCGKPVADATHNRVGEWCSDAHADEYVAEVRSKKQRELASAHRPRETQRDQARELEPRFGERVDDIVASLRGSTVVKRTGG